MADDTEKKKNIFDKAFDLVSSRDEKAALEKAQLELEETRKKAAEAQALAQQAAAQKTAEAQKALEDAQKKAAEADVKASELEAQLLQMKSAEAARIAAEQTREFEARRTAAVAAAQAVAEAATPKFVAEHTLSPDETLSHLALKYYGHATPPYWKLIYEANKDVIGDNPNHVRSGMTIKIPVLPPDFKG